MTTWILLRGLARESRHWGRFPDMLRREVGEAKVYAPDLPGNGRLHAVASPPSVAGLAEQCRDGLCQAGVAPPYHLLALSLGAMVAVAWAARHPEEVAGCVLINTSLRPLSPFHQRLRPASYLPLLGLLLPGGDAASREAAILRLTSRRAGDAAGVLAEWAGYRRQCPTSAGNALRQLLAALRYRAPAVRPPVPILVLASRGDALVDPRCSRRLASHWDTAFAEHPTAGHDLALDDGPWVARQVVRWLQAPPRHKTVISGS